MRAGHSRGDGYRCTVDDQNINVDNDHIDDSCLLVDGDSAVVARRSRRIHPDGSLGSRIINRSDRSTDSLDIRRTTRGYPGVVSTGIRSSRHGDSLGDRGGVRTSANNSDICSIQTG